MSKHNSCAYFFTPQPSVGNHPLFVFLPGMDETGKELMCLQTEGLEKAFDVRCFVIPPDELTSWDTLADQVLALTQAELEKLPRSSIYLCGESFGACIALKVLEKSPQFFNHIIIINSASSFHRIFLLNFGSLLFPLTPTFLYKISSYIALPFLASINRLSPDGKKYLLKAVNSAPKETANQRLSLMRNFTLDEQQLSQVTQPVLLVASQDDKLLPSQDEAQRLASIFPHAQIVTLPYSGHACLVEEDTNLLKILQAKTQNLDDSSAKNHSIQ